MQHAAASVCTLHMAGACRSSRFRPTMAIVRKAKYPFSTLRSRVMHSSASGSQIGDLQPSKIWTCACLRDAFLLHRCTLLTGTNARLHGDAFSPHSPPCGSGLASVDGLSTIDRKGRLTGQGCRPHRSVLSACRGCSLTMKARDCTVNTDRFR